MKVELDPKIGWAIGIVLVLLLIVGGYRYIDASTTFNDGRTKPPGAPPPPPAMPPSGR